LSDRIAPSLQRVIFLSRSVRAAIVCNSLPTNGVCPALCSARLWSSSIVSVSHFHPSLASLNLKNHCNLIKRRRNKRKLTVTSINENHHAQSGSHFCGWNGPRIPEANVGQATRQGQVLLQDQLLRTRLIQSKSGPLSRTSQKSRIPAERELLPVLCGHPTRNRTE